MKPSLLFIVRPLRRLFGAVLLAAAFSPLPAAAQDTDTSNEHLPLRAATVAGHPVQIQIASTPRQLELGLMYRDSLPADQGMLFVFPAARQLCFWMKNTRIPLTIAFADQNSVITDIIDMKPFDLTPHCSSRDAVYGLEMNQGWFQRKHIQAGDRLIDIN